MASPYFSVVTDVGTTEMVKALNEDRKLNIIEFAVGDGNGAYYSPTQEMTALRREVWRGSVHSCRISEDNENVLVIESVIPANEGGFTIREMAIFDDKGNMIAVCNTPDTQKVKVSDGVVHELALSLEILVYNTDSIELMVDPNVVTATKKDIERLRQSLTQSINIVNIAFQEEMQKALKSITGLQIEVDNIKNDMLRMGVILSVLVEADALGADNMMLESFNTTDDVIIISGFFDNENHRLYA